MSSSAGVERPESAGEGAAEERLFDVSLVDYAVVSAGVAEGFPLEDVLSIEGIKPRAYAKAEVKWKERVAASGANKGALFERYRAELAKAEDWLDRRVTPLDEEPAAWVAFLHAYSTAQDPAALLKSSGLGTNDMARLSRRWARRAEADARVVEEIAGLKAKGTGPMPAVKADPPRLRPSPTARAQSMGSRAGPNPGAPARANTPWVRGAISTGQDLPGEPQATPELKELEAPAALPRSPLWGDPEATIAPPPMRAPIAVPPVTPVVIVEAPVRAAPPAGVSATQAAGARPGGLTVEQYASLCAEVHLSPARAGEIAGRYRIDPAAAPSIDAAWQRLLAADRELYAAYLSTYNAYKAWLTGWSPELARAAASVSPTEGALPSPAAHHTSKAAAPQLSLQQFASLTVDLSMDPARRAETLARYRITEDQKAEIDAVWGSRFHADPSARAAYDQAVASYRAWLAQRR
jgi:hypothetical protein